MDIQILNKKIELINWLSALEDESVIKKLMEFRKKETTNWQHTISYEEKASIEAGITQADNKQLKSHSKARELYEKWL